MDIRIEARHFEATSGLHSFITDKVEKLQHFFDRIQNCDVILQLDSSDTRKNKVVELVFNVPGLKLFAKEQDETFEAAASRAVDYMKKQLIKHKEKLSGHKPAADQVTEEKEEEDF